MKTSELIAAVGDDKVGVQFIDTCNISMDWDHKKGTRITFGTDVKLIFNEGTERLGMIVWMDRDAVKAALAAEKAKKAEPSP